MLFGVNGFNGPGVASHVTEEHRSEYAHVQLVEPNVRRGKQRTISETAILIHVQVNKILFLFFSVFLMNGLHGPVGGTT